MSEVAGGSNKWLLLLDSGADVHIVPYSWATELGLSISPHQLAVKDAGGHDLGVMGRATLEGRVQNTGGKFQPLAVEVLVARGVSKAILSAGQLVRAGFTVTMTQNETTIGAGTQRVKCRRVRTRDFVDLQPSSPPAERTLETATITSLKKDVQRLERELQRMKTGQASAVPVPAPSTPTDQEREEYMATHIPYKDWCRECVTARGGVGHRGQGSDLAGPETYQFDLTWLQKMGAPTEGSWVLVGCSSRSKMVGALVLGAKKSHPHLKAWIVDFVAQTRAGPGPVILKCDQEALMGVWLREAGSEIPGGD